MHSDQKAAVSNQNGQGLAGCMMPYALSFQYGRDDAGPGEGARRRICVWPRAKRRRPAGQGGFELENEAGMSFRINKSSEIRSHPRFGEFSR
jgi:hypothetical protein